MNAYTVVIQNLDRTAALVRHAEAETPRAAYERILRDLYDAAGLDAEEDPFDLAEAETDRPLLCIFAGHHEDISV